MLWSYSRQRKELSLWEFFLFPRNDGEAILTSHLVSFDEISRLITVLLVTHVMHLKIASPEKQIYAGEVEQMTLPTESGEITILPGHIPLTTVVSAGILRCTPAQLPVDT